MFEFKQVEPRELLPAVERALGILKERSPLPLAWEEGVPMLLATQCGGDVRKAINACELLYEAAETKDGELLKLAGETAAAVCEDDPSLASDLYRPLKNELENGPLSNRSLRAAARLRFLKIPALLLSNVPGNGIIQQFH